MFKNRSFWASAVIAAALLAPFQSFAGIEDYVGDYENAPTYSEDLKKSADSGDTEAQFKLAQALYYGKGCKPDKKKADKMLEKAAKGGNADAMYICATNLLPIDYVGKRLDNSDSKKMKKVLEYLKNASLKNHTGAMLLMSEFYTNGVYGVKTVSLMDDLKNMGKEDFTPQVGDQVGEEILKADPDKVAELYKKVYKVDPTSHKRILEMAKNNPIAAKAFDGIELSDDDFDGNLWKLTQSPKDQTLRQKCENIAQSGTLEQVKQLAEMYKKEDPKESFKWYEKALNMGDKSAADELYPFCLGYEGYPLNFDRALQLIDMSPSLATKVNKEKLQKIISLSKATDAKSLLEVGNMYLNGVPEIGLDPSPKSAVPFYEKGANLKNIDCIITLGNLYKNKLNEPTKAFETYKKGANLGNAKCITEVGDCYYDGTGVEKDRAKAFTYFTKAAATGDAYAQYSVGFCYEKGQGVAQNKAKAKEWYRKAISNGSSNAQEALNAMEYVDPLLKIYNSRNFVGLGESDLNALKRAGYITASIDAAANQHQCSITIVLKDGSKYRLTMPVTYGAIGKVVSQTKVR